MYNSSFTNFTCHAFAEDQATACAEELRQKNFAGVWAVLSKAPKNPQ